MAQLHTTLVFESGGDLVMTELINQAKVPCYMEIMEQLEQRCSHQLTSLFETSFWLTECNHNVINKRKKLDAQASVVPFPVSSQDHTTSYLCKHKTRYSSLHVIRTLRLITEAYL